MSSFRFSKRPTRLIGIAVAAACAAQVSALRAAPALADNDTVIIADFVNRTGDAVLDNSLKQALLLELSQSPFLNVLSDGKLSETLRSMGHPANESISRADGRPICIRAGSKAMLGGTIALVGDRYAIDLSAIDCSTGDTLAQAHGDAKAKSDILKSLNQSSSKLRTELGESEASVRQFNIPVAATTSSLDALDSYSIGVTVRREQGDGPSIPPFKRAVERDPQFAMAYAVLAVIYRNLREPSLALEYATKAYQYRDSVSEREKLHIAATYFLVTGEVDKEIPIYERWKADYRRDFVPYNNLGNDYIYLGELEKGLPEYQEGVRLMPSVVGYTNVMGVELNLDRLDAAQATFDEAIASNLDGRYLRQNLYSLAFLRGDEKRMAKQVSWASGKPGDEDVFLSMQSDSEAYQGRVRAARDLTARAVRSAMKAGSEETAGLWQINGALREAELGDSAAAKEHVAAARTLSSGKDVLVMSAFTLARAHDADAASELAAKLEKDYPTDTLMKLYWLPTIHAAISLERGRYSQALDTLKTASPYELGNAGMFINYLYPAYVRGQAYLLARDPNAAATEFEKLAHHRGIVSNFITGALVHLQLGRAYAMSGDVAKAKLAYQDFIDLWKRADGDSQVLSKAKAEYAELTA